ncbi:MAG: phenylalanine--tRNA ligase subunit beta [Candidatus Omnitrophota bacterium]|jgi:phenylalanyl-tRNA synthetase beta chain
MKINYNWLKDYIDVKLSPEKLAELLTMSGLTVDSLERKGDDAILEIEVTSNRPDWLSYIGVAREIAALTGKILKIPLITANRKSETKNLINVKIEDKKLCPRYTARVISNIKIEESPEWLKSRIEAMGLKSVNNVVDITNFCLFETGEPMHAFDLDRLSGGKIIVRTSRKGERITTIDGVERTLEEGVLVIADDSRPVAVAGVMGGLNTEVTASTKNILLEAAAFDPISIRRTSRVLGLPSESSYRFERKVDLANISYASARASAMIMELAGGQEKAFIDIGSKQEKNKPVELRFSRLNSVLGVEIPAQKAKKILTALGLKIISSSKDKIKFSIPGFRSDLKNEIDLIEEAARIYGYDKIPDTIPGMAASPARESHDITIAQFIRALLTGMGLDEIITYSLLSKDIILKSGSLPEAIVEVKNPLSGEQEAMRVNLAGGMLNSIIWNINRKTKDLKLFELGNIYIKDGDGKFVERKHLSIGMAGEIADGSSGPRKSSFFDLKGVIQVLLSELGVKDVSFTDTGDGNLSPSARASINAGQDNIGVLGEVSRRTLTDFDIKENVYYSEVDIDSILKHVNLEKRFMELPRYPSVFRDISIVVNKGISNADIISLIESKGATILKDVRLVDRYAGKQIPDGKISLTYRLEYRDNAKTLEDKEVLGVHSDVLRSLEEKFGAKLR